MVVEANFCHNSGSLVILQDAISGVTLASTFCVQDLAFASFIESEALTAVDQHSSIALISWSSVVAAPYHPHLWLRRMACGILDQGSNPGPWQLKCRVLTTGPPGNSSVAAPLDETYTLQFSSVPTTPCYFTDTMAKVRCDLYLCTEH